MNYQPEGPGNTPSGRKTENNPAPSQPTLKEFLIAQFVQNSLTDHDAIIILAGLISELEKLLAEMEGRLYLIDQEELPDNFDTQSDGHRGIFGGERQNRNQKQPTRQGRQRQQWEELKKWQKDQEEQWRGQWRVNGQVNETIGRLNNLLNAALGRVEESNRGTSAISPGSSDQYLRMRDDYSHLKTQQFENVARSILHYFPQLPISSGKDESNSMKKALIKAVIAKNILLTEDRSIPSPAEAVNRVWNDLGISEIIQRSQDPSSNLKKPLDEVQLSLTSLATEGLRLTERIRKADPPGFFDFPKIQSRFDPLTHQTLPGNEESGILTLVVFPAYVVSNKIVEKAVVLTLPGNVQMDSEIV